MALTAPVAAKTLYENGLSGLITNITGGRIALLSALPTDIDSGSFAVCGVADDSVGATNVGSAVLGFADIGSISAVVEGDSEGAGEHGWKVTFGQITGVNVDTTGTAIAFAMVKSTATFAGGVDTDILYIVDLTDIAVSASTTVNIPTWDIEIQYGTNAP